MLATDDLLREVRALPTGDDTITHVWNDTSTITFLRNSAEIPDNGELIRAGSFIENGVLTGITLLEFEINGC